MVYRLQTILRSVATELEEQLVNSVTATFQPGMHVVYSWKGRVMSGVIVRGPDSSMIDHTVVTVDDIACYLLVKSDCSGKIYPVRHQNIRIEGEKHD